MTLALRTVHVGDCRELLRQLDDNSINCVVTSPPYWGLRDYRIARSEWGDGWTGCLGLEPTPQQFVDHVVEVFRAVRRVLRPDGTIWLNLGDSYCATARGSASPETSTLEGRPSIGAPTDKRGYRGDRLANGRKDQSAVLRKKTRALRDGTHAGKHTAIAASGPMLQVNRNQVPGLKPKDLVGVPWRVAFALQADGWWLRSDIIWAKPNPMPESVLDRPTKAHEYLFLLSKSDRYYYDATAIREPQMAPEASTPDDAARAFSRRRADAPKQRQEPVDARKIRATSGNKERKHRIDHGGPSDSTKRVNIPWDATDGMRNKRSVWTVATEPYEGAHFATFPMKLVEPCVLAGCPMGGVVLDPFAGSGTVAQVCEELGRNWILFELNPAYAELARARTAQRGLFVTARG